MIDNAQLIVGAIFILLLTAEILYPRDKVKKDVKNQSYKSNIELFVINGIFISSILIFFPMEDILPRQSNYNITHMLLSFILIDLVLYVWHLLAHKVDLLWFIHRIHHNDKIVHTATSFRLHPIEILILNAIKFMAALLLGLDQQMLALNELIATGFVMFHHSNIKLKFENLLSYIFIVPSLHKVHHLSNRKDHDSNYGTIFSIWDRLFGTLKESGKSSIGLLSDSPQNTTGLLKYGLSNPSKPLINIAPAPHYNNISFQEMVEKAAYYRAQKRDFSPGDDQYDWFEAEKEVHRMLNA